MENQNQSSNQIGIVQSNGTSVAIESQVYPIHYEYLCYAFKPGSRIRGYVQTVPNITDGSLAISPRYGQIVVQKINKGFAFFSNNKLQCEVRLLCPLTAPSTVFIPKILLL